MLNQRHNLLPVPSSMGGYSPVKISFHWKVALVAGLLWVAWYFSRDKQSVKTNPKKKYDLEDLVELEDMEDLLYGPSDDQIMGYLIDKESVSTEELIKDAIETLGPRTLPPEVEDKGVRELEVELRKIRYLLSKAEMGSARHKQLSSRYNIIRKNFMKRAMRSIKR